MSRKHKPYKKVGYTHNDKIAIQRERATEGLKSTGDMIVDGLIGLADWVGLGRWIENEIKDTKAYKNKDKLINSLKDKINEKISRGQIDINQLQEKLYELPNIGLNLDGRAADIARNYNNNTSKQRRDTQALINKKQAQQDIRVAKGDQLISELSNEPNRGYVTHLTSDLSKDYEKEIGEL